MYKKKGNHVITQATEHKATLDTCKRLERDGFQVTYLPVDKYGQVHAEQVREALTDKTILVSHHGREQRDRHRSSRSRPSASCARRRASCSTPTRCRRSARCRVDVEEMGIDLLSLTAHKIYGPKGIGALYVRKKDPRVRLEPQIDGGGHERGMRSGHAAGAADRRARRRPATSPAGEMPEESKRTFAPPRAAPQGHHGPAARVVPERPPDRAAAGQREHQLRLRRGRGADDGDQGRGGVERVGLHERQPGAELRPAGPGRRRRTGPLAASASASAGSTPRRRSISWSTWSSAR